MADWEEYNYRLYDELHCPYCGSTDIYTSTEIFNYKAGFWGGFFLHFGILLFGFLCRKRTKCYCNRCGGEFSFYKSKSPL